MKHSESLLPPAAKPQGIYVRRAESDADIRAAQHLRYQVFYEECGAKPLDGMAEARLDFDEFDRYADHLLVIDPDHGSGDENVVGTYRLLRQDVAEQAGKFYTSNEFDISPLVTSGGKLLELGRSCVLEGYRTKPVLEMLWQGIADYVADHQIDLMFGCGSLPGINPNHWADELSLLYYYHLSPDSLRPRALAERYVAMDRKPKSVIHPKHSFMRLPPLIKGYLRLGATIGDGAIIDEQFNTIDVCIIMPTHLVADRYMKHYERKNQKTMLSESDFRDRLAQNKSTQKENETI